MEDLKREVALLRAQLDSLKSLQQVSPADLDDQLDQLSLRIEKKLQQLEQKVDAMGRSTAPIAFNPRTTAFINFAARHDDRTVMDEYGVNDLTNKPFVRSAEIDMRAPVDPYAEAVLIVSIENEGGKEFAVDPEEAYGLLKRLPILESAPMGLKLRVGKFRAPLGNNNKVHMHDLPWTTRPLVIAKLLGTEHTDFLESGYNTVGADFDFFLPNPIPVSTLEMNLDLLRAGDLRVSQGRDGGRTGYLGRLNWSADWNNEHILVLGGSGYHEKGPTSTDLFGVDLTYKWAPSVNREGRSFVAGGEWFTAKHEFNAAFVGPTTVQPSGWFAYAQYQLSYWWYLGGRYDWTNEPDNDKVSTKGLSGYLSYYTTEFLRFRAGIEHRTSTIPGVDPLTTALFEINFVFGSHPTEPYWVNR
jgi:hypothetical protein